MIPKDALYTENSRKYVRVLEGNTIHKRYVTVGLDSGVGSGMVWISQGVEPGQVLILK